jgi:hypothetical protein
MGVLYGILITLAILFLGYLFLKKWFQSGPGPF